MNNQKLSDEQVRRIEIAMKQVAEINPYAQALHSALLRNPFMDDKRKVIASAYGNMYFVMVHIQMCLDATVSPEEFQKRLEDAANKKEV